MVCGFKSLGMPSTSSLPIRASTVHVGRCSFPCREETCLTLSKPVLHAVFDQGAVCASVSSVYSYSLALPRCGEPLRRY